ncbi:hypothetical protein DAPPUDRAFT_302569 [Daphnia pulex]|uniref:Uncharacterized protein n=1 Tax=Daphnia pulex TaxID=6669 RepID=E9GEB7_DAPPU|nr:hypothetical protein DAPPUDRAFT_302569 [Daphnia pulex]|eukprot:EFX82334.1 hypothetical protein DAPPUDRAFT_302569 [Daphnia pulex]
MEKALAIANVVFGVVTFCFHDPESATVGICGGIYLMVFGLLLISSKLKNKVIIIGLGVKATFIGIALISLYTKSFDSYQGLLDNCQLIATVIYGLKQCDRIAWDPIMAVLGLLIIVVNSFLAVITYISKSNSNSKTIVGLD